MYPIHGNSIAHALTGGLRAAPPPPPPAPHVAPVVPQAPRKVPSGGGASDPYALPPGQTLGQAASGKQAQPFDVTLSRLATAVYGSSRPGPPEPWHAVSDEDLRAHGVADPAAWRAQYLGGGTQTDAQHFKAEIYTDGNGNYVLSYRGTDGSGPDWGNNFKQGAGFETNAEIDKFSGLAANTAVEFAQRFGNDSAHPDNLAITGHSQGGGLATVGSIASGVPAVTFDASGIHPNTWDRLGVDPQKARDIAENGQIRAYSLKDDLLTQTQESGPLGLLAPDALGTKIVVQPSGAQDAKTIEHGLEIETGMKPSIAGPLGAALEIAHRVPVPLLAGTGIVLGGVLGGPIGGLIGGPLGGLVGGTIGVAGDLTRGAVSHSPELLTDAMIQQQPWQPGYRNPVDVGKWLQKLVPDAAKDNIARNVHDRLERFAATPFAGDLAHNVQEARQGIVDVIDNQFKDGRYVEGGFRIAGDLGKGAIDTFGDALHRDADTLADSVDARVPGRLGDALSSVVSFGGDVARAATRTAGGVFERAMDANGMLMGWLTGH